MQYRKSLSSKKSKRNFRAGSRNVKKRNYIVGPMRGGIRL